MLCVLLLCETLFWQLLAGLAVFCSQSLTAIFPSTFLKPKVKWMKVVQAWLDAETYFIVTLQLFLSTLKKHIKRIICLQDTEKTELFFSSFFSSPTNMGRNSICVQEDPDPLHLPLVAAGMNKACRWEQPQHLAAHLLPPEEAFCVHNYRLGSF